MTPDLRRLPEPFRAEVATALEHWRNRSGADPAVLATPAIASQLPLVWACSRFVTDACQKDPPLLAWLAAPDGRLDQPADPTWFEAQLDAQPPEGSGDAGLMATLRHFRRRQLARIAWRDLAGLADIDTVLRELTQLADACITRACDWAHVGLAARHGEPKAADGRPVPLTVLGMGKLGGGELNFSSDIDLVFVFPEHGETGGARPVDHEEYYIRLGRRLNQLLGTVTEDGFVYRVDMRLRPFGESGPLAVSYDALEDYLQQHGRDWERYAYVKARPIVGTQRFPELYRDVLRPFVYRRYLDFSVFESLREMKELIARDVERRELQHNVKLGPGGIREIEFIVQAFQLIRGGSDARLQTRSLFEALQRIAGRKLLTSEAVDELADSYRFLRRVENRLQQWNDEQTHDLPADATARERLALAMGAPDWPTLEREIERHRARVNGHFQSVVIAPAQPGAQAGAAQWLEHILEPEIDDGERLRLLQQAGLRAPEAVHARLAALRDSSYFRRMDEAGRRRLQQLMPRLLHVVAGGEHEDVALGRVLHVLERIGGRTVYLALLNENAVALRRLVELCTHSQFLTDQVAAFPLLLDELLDERLFEALPTRAEFERELRERMAGAAAEDPERQVEMLREFQRAAVFRVAVPDLTGRLPLMKVSDRLTDIAELIVGAALELAWHQIGARHGMPRCVDADGATRTAGVIVVAYGKFGGIELGYGSDLDLVFLHDAGGEGIGTDGAKPIENSVFLLRLVQRLVHVLTVHSAAGRLYEVDTRLRPSGKGGLLVQSLAGFADYQRDEAWTWEHQALLRARAVAGPAGLRAAFERTRVELLRTAVHRDRLRDDVRGMRERMRAELSRSRAGEFDLKQDPGGITDIEFLAQYWALHFAERYPELVTYSDNIRQLESLASADLVPQATVDVLTGAYRSYRQRMHHLSLEARSNVVPAAEFADLRERVLAIWRATMEGSAVL